ncbi:MAG TPA: alpha/beta hydrolase [Puia sp.]|nr:alpha/beta hydrolase [Puia sp.]
MKRLMSIRAKKVSVSRRRRNVFRVFRYGILVGIGVFLYAVFWPRTYGSPVFERHNVQYWELQTGSRIAYNLIPGKGHKRPYPIIFLEGGPGGPVSDGAVNFRSFLADDGYDVFLYDLVGCGLSSRLRNVREYTPERHKRDLEEIVERTGAGKVILIGQSWGAMLAVLYATDHPGKLAKMIFTGPGPILPIHSKLSYLPAPDSLHLRKPYYSNQQGNDQANNIRTRAMAFCAKHFGIKLAPDKEADDFASYLNTAVNRSVVADTANIKKNGHLSGVGYYCQVMTYASFGQVQDSRPRLKNLPVPVLVMKGQYDNQPWGFTHEYLDLFPNHQLVIIPAAGHAISLEQPEYYRKIVREFLNK